MNPKGVPHGFRGVDWVVELNNLYIKYIYGGEGSNHTKMRVILESMLILVFRSSHANFERNFHLKGLSTKHAEKDMTVAIAELRKYLQEHGANEFQPGRTANTKLQDLLVRGAAMVVAASEKHNAGMSADITDDLDGAAELRVEMTAEDFSIDDLI